MHLRTFSTACLLLCLGVATPACDDTKTDAKAKADEKKTDEKKTDAKVDEKKAEDPKVDEKKVDDTKVDDAKVDDAKVDDAKVDAKVDDAKVDEKKAEDPKVDEKKADPKKTDDKKTPPKDPPKPDDAKADPGPGIDGKALYGTKCKNCHGVTGDGKTKIGEENDIEDWTAAGWKAKWTEAKVIDIVTNGKSGTKMKPFKDKLSADEIAAVSKYSRSLGK